MYPDAKKLVLEHSNQLQECRLERVKVRVSNKSRITLLVMELGEDIIIRDQSL